MGCRPDAWFDRPSCAVADYQDGQVGCGPGTQNPHMLRADLALYAGAAGNRNRLIRMEAAGCYGRQLRDDVQRRGSSVAPAVGRPVRVQLTREQEHAWEPKGARN